MRANLENSPSAFIQASRGDLQGKRTQTEPLIPNPTGKNNHLSRAMLLVHPYAKTVKLEADLAYAVRCSASLGPDALRISSERFKVLRQLARTCSPADTYTSSPLDIHIMPRD